VIRERNGAEPSSTKYEEGNMATKMLLSNIGLILEGGGMRGAYTAGALDYLLDAGLEFPRVYAVSAGACHAYSYISKQRGRAINVVLTSLPHWRYGTCRSLLHSGDFFDKHYYYELPKSILPLDYETFRSNSQKLIVVVTNVKTGQAEYRLLSDAETGMEWVRASASLPLLSRLVAIAGNSYLDGGVADSIPLARSIADGQKKNVLILTRHRGYCAPTVNRLVDRAMRLRYRKYPEFIHTYMDRHRTYNATLDLAEKEAETGRALIIQPQEEVKIGRLEKNPEKVKALYELGYRDAEECFEEYSGFLFI
jgi:predicted patatin/cPLA2 family phospholipase